MAYAIGLKEKYPRSKMTVVGHSLGGVLATLSVLDLNHRGIKVDNLYTYGYLHIKFHHRSPRLGNGAFA